MNADTEITIDALHTAIINKVKAAFPDLNVEAYRQERDTLTLPACLIELQEMEAAPENDPGTGQLAVRAQFSAALVISFRQGAVNPKLSIRKLAAALSAFVHQQRWGVPVEAANFTGAYPDDFDPELDKYEIWRVDWHQIVHLGESVWDDAGATVPTEIYFGHHPAVGAAHEDEYQQVQP